MQTFTSSGEYGTTADRRPPPGDWFDEDRVYVTFLYVYVTGGGRVI